MRSFSKYLKSVLLVISDMLAVVLASVIALLATRGVIILDGGMLHSYVALMLLGAVTVAGVFALCRLYSNVSDYVGAFEGVKLIFCCILLTAVHVLVAKYLLALDMIANFAYALIFVFILVSFTALPRYFSRAVRAVGTQLHSVGKGSGKRVMIVGAGDAGVSLLRELQITNKVDYNVVCFIDDDVKKIGTYIMGVRVVGDRTKIPECVKRYGVKEIYIAMPSVGGRVIEEIASICTGLGCVVKTLPGIYQFVNGEVSIHSLREVSIEDLLARDAIDVDLDKVMDYVTGKVVMVTGGGGSIGSELCRQIASHNPHRLIIVDIYENNAYDIQQELIKSHPHLNLVTLIASVRDEKRMERIFKVYKPQIVYHAAAHKHVPLMEESPNEAIKNNVFGTYKTATLADKYGVKRFVLISTDKAVNPTNVMGATKRICEMIVQSLDKRSKTEFVAVRFGNVLGSNGSVVPLFKKQIAQGGPVLVTHPEIIRYFMTITEAVALVIQAGAYAKGGEIFVLDMGKPVKILDLAENLIRLSGLEPYRDVDIKFTGLRPGEKLYEEMLMNEEGLAETDNKLIHIGKPIEMDENIFFAQLDELKHVLDEEPDNARYLIGQMVPTYTGNKDLLNI